MGVGQVGYILFIFLYFSIFNIFNIFLIFLIFCLQGVLHVLGEARVRFIRVGATQVMIT